ncbi:MAG: pilus assembly protein PilM, partial [Parcubacteria group bacterium]|nr:pilus assembly protein PilM [Parcubacteria group bacterium]
PEDKVFLRIVDLPALKKSELASAVKSEVESNIPLPLNEVYYDYEVVNGGGSVMINAAPKAVVDSYAGFFERLGWRLLALEIDAVASARAMLGWQSKRPEDGAVLLLDIGDTRTRFVMVRKGVVRFTSSGDVAGNAFTAALSDRLGVTANEAELMKKLVGINRNHENGREFLEIFSPLLDQLKDQIQHHVSFFETHGASDKTANNGRGVSRIILAGGGANLAGLSDWLSQQLGLVVMPANPLKSWNISGRGTESTMSWEESLSYVTAIGSTLRNFVL